MSFDDNDDDDMELCPGELSAYQYLCILQNQRQCERIAVEDVGSTSPSPPPPPPSKPLMRSGCVACLQANRRCDPENPECLQHTISDNWKVNRPLSSHQFGTWRDRAGLHMFFRFINAPEKSGMFKSPFWHDTIMTACMHCEPLYYVGSAIGYLHEYVRSRADSNATGNDSLQFALQQSNLSLALLTSPKNADINPGIALLACVLFVAFEALYGNFRGAIKHSIEGRKILAALETSDDWTQDLALAFAPDVRVIIIGQELQARCVPEVKWQPLNTLTKMRAVRLPAFDRLTNLSDAHFTLHVAYVNLLDFLTDIRTTERRADVISMLGERVALYLPWLQHWQQSFINLLTEGGPSLLEKETQRINILRVNYDTVYIFATCDFGPEDDSWDPYIPRFRSILDLSASVLRASRISPTATSSGVHFPFMPQCLWVNYPLYVTMARCPDREISWHAAQVLLAQRRRTVSRARERNPSEALPVDDPDSWTTEEWIRYVQKESLDVTCPIFFGGFKPSEDEQRGPNFIDDCYEIDGGGNDHNDKEVVDFIM